ncbi:hypothetical protein ABBQ32_010631 [Trebouxia sp. C0010 RCD-2024]
MSGLNIDLGSEHLAGTLLGSAVHAVSAACLSAFCFFAFSAEKAQAQQARVPCHLNWLSLSGHESQGQVIWYHFYQTPCVPAEPKKRSLLSPHLKFATWWRCNVRASR